MIIEGDTDKIDQKYWLCVPSIQFSQGFWMIVAIFENILIMILTIVGLLGGGYLALMILEWGLKIKSGQREHERLTNLWIATQSQSNSIEKPKQVKQNEK